MNYCKVCTGVLDCGLANLELNNHGIFLLHDYQYENSMYALKVNERICGIELPSPYGIIGYIVVRGWIG